MNISITFVFLTLFSILTFNQTARAGLLLEPYLGYAFSGHVDTGTSAALTGSELGARVGYSTFGFAVGAEYMSRTLKDDSSPSKDYTGSDIGIFASFKFPVLFRVYASYFPSSELKVSSSGSTAKLKSGNVTKLGFGFTGLPIVNINLEYQTGVYKKVNILGSDFDLDPSTKTDNVALVVSAPFDLF